MKKMYKLLSMLLAVAMLLTSAALAEGTVPMNYIELGDIQITMDGEQLLDLSGLKVKLGAGASESVSEAALTLSLAGGETEVTNAVIGAAEGIAFANLDGMNKPVTVDLNELFSEENVQAMIDAFMEGFSANFTEEEMAALGQIYEGVMELTSDEGMETWMTSYMEYMGTIGGLTEETLYTAEVSNVFYMGEGEEETAYLESVILTHEAIATGMGAVYDMYDHPAMLKIINGFLVLGGEEPVASIDEIMTEEVIEEAVSESFGEGDVQIDVYTNEDDSLLDIVITTLDDAYADEPEVFGSIEIGIGMTDSLNMMFNLSADDDVLYASFDAVPSEDYPGEVEYFAYMEETVYGETMPLLSMWIGPDPTYGTLGTISLLPESEYDAVGIAWGVAEGQYIFSGYTSDSSFEIGYVADGVAEGSDLIYLTADDYGTVVEISASLTASEGEIPASDLTKLAKTKGVDLLTATPEELGGVAQKCMMVLALDMMELAEEVPVLAEMMGLTE